jgi:quercetin dioxygenase-like cupin family protein
MHISVLSPEHSPHSAAQTHLQEELLIILDGEAEVLVDGKNSYQRLGRGSFVHWPAYMPHTLRNVSCSPVTYAVLKWRAAPIEVGQPLRTATFHMGEPSGRSNSKPMAMRKLFESPTAMLDKLHCHVTELQPGAGYPPHADEHDVIIFMFSGKVETLGQTVTRNGVIYYSAGEVHGLQNVGDEPAHYLVFEFHGARQKPSPLAPTSS